MNIPQLQIKQTFGQISINRVPGKQEIEQPHAKVEMKTENSFLHMETTDSHLEIDQSRAWAAYGMMKPLEWNKFIYSQTPAIVQEAIANIAQKGSRLAKVHKDKDAIANIAFDSMFRSNPIRYAGEAAIDNVDIYYTPSTIKFNPTEGKVHIHVEPQQPIIHYRVGHVDIGMLQYPSIQFEWRGNHIDKTL